jgi:hypothetical protein
VFSLWVSDQTSAAVVSQSMVGEEEWGREKAFGGDRVSDCCPSSRILLAFKPLRAFVR